MSDYVDFYTIILALTSAYIVKTAISGVFLERLHRRACTRDCGIYYRKWGDCEGSSEKIWDKQEYGAYGSNNKERLLNKVVWRIE